MTSNNPNQTGFNSSTQAGGPSQGSATTPTTRPSFEYTPAPQPQGLSKKQINILIAAVCGGVAILGLGVAKSFLFPSTPTPAAAQAPRALSPMEEQTKMMREAMQMAREAQEMQREKLELMREEMEASGEHPADTWDSSSSSGFSDE